MNRTSLVSLVAVVSAFLGLGGSSFGQSPLLEVDSGGQFIRLKASGLNVQFDRSRGGAPLNWKYSTSAFTDMALVDNNSGRGFQTTYDSGQDSTQTSANGVTLFEVNRFNETVGSANYNYRIYYMNEAIDYGNNSASPPVPPSYTVRGFCPDFWLSDEQIDDFIPPGTTQTQWLTNWQPMPTYTGATTYGACVTSNGGASGKPVFFQARSTGNNLGVFMPANNYDTALPRAISNGRMAARMNVSLKDASASGAFGALMFRRSSSAGTSLDEAYKSTGYQLAVNKAGSVVFSVQRTYNGGYTTLGTWTATTQNTAKGTLLELRTADNSNLRVIGIWIDQVNVGYYTDNMSTDAVVTGPLVGMMASGGYLDVIAFGDREIFDVGTEMVSKHSIAIDTNLNPFSGTYDPYIRSELTIRNAPNVPWTEPRQMYRVNTVSFRDLGTPTPDHIWWLNHSLAFSPYPTLTAAIPQPPPPAAGPAFIKLICNGNDLHAAWAGKESGDYGLYCVPEYALVNPDGSGNVAATGAHLLAQCPPNKTPNYLIHLNAVVQQPDPAVAPSVPHAFVSTTLSARWYPRYQTSAAWISSTPPNP